MNGRDVWLSRPWSYVTPMPVADADRVQHVANRRTRKLQATAAACADRAAGSATARRLRAHFVHARPRPRRLRAVAHRALDFQGLGQRQRIAGIEFDGQPVFSGSGGQLILRFELPGAGDVLAGRLANRALEGDLNVGPLGIVRQRLAVVRHGGIPLASLRGLRALFGGAARRAPGDQRQRQSECAPTKIRPAVAFTHSHALLFLPTLADHALTGSIQVRHHDVVMSRPAATCIGRRRRRLESASKHVAFRVGQIRAVPRRLLGIRQ